MRDRVWRLDGLEAIWCRAPHNAFTDLARFRDRNYCVFREGETHVSRDGVIRLLRAEEGQDWQQVCTFQLPGHDLRDPHLVATDDGRLLLHAGCVTAGEWSLVTVISETRDGVNWSALRKVGEERGWIWRMAWAPGFGLGVGYFPRDNPPFVRLYETRDGQAFQPLASTLFDRGYPNECGLVVDAQGQAVCLLRRDGEGDFTAQLGRAWAPYGNWEWQDLGMPLGSPHLILGPKGSLIGAARLYDPDWKARVSLIAFDSQGRLEETFRFPSSGDCGYPGMIWDNEKEELWVSYYSSHEGRASIYVARLRLGR